MARNGCLRGWGCVCDSANRTVKLACAHGLVVVHFLYRSDQCFPRMAFDNRRSGTRRLAKTVFVVDERSGLRRIVGVLELLGTVQMDLHRSLFRQRKNLRNARAR